MLWGHCGICVNVKLNLAIYWVVAFNLCFWIELQGTKTVNISLYLAHKPVIARKMVFIRESELIPKSM